LYETVKQQKGQIDVLFANAGIFELVSLGSITEEHFDKIFSVNVKGVLFTVQMALPLFRDGGSIILIASVAGSKGFEGSSVYSATKDFPPNKEIYQMQPLWLCLPVRDGC
ncbi:MAG: SDR family oxidoreductase, partial [Candidatus Nitrosopolaris sp.]